MASASKAIDGIPYDAYKARFTGSPILESDEAERLTVGEVVILCTVVKVKDIQSKLNRHDELERVAVCGVTDARVLDPDVSRLLVERLGLFGSDTGSFDTPSNDGFRPFDDPGPMNPEGPAEAEQDDEESENPENDEEDDFSEVERLGSITTGVEQFNGEKVTVSRVIEKDRALASFLAAGGMS